jgi:hypothetical protein
MPQCCGAESEQKHRAGLPTCCAWLVCQVVADARRRRGRRGQIRWQSRRRVAGGDRSLNGPRTRRKLPRRQTKSRDRVGSSRRAPIGGVAPATTARAGFITFRSIFCGGTATSGSGGLRSHTVAATATSSTPLAVSAPPPLPVVNVFAVDSVPNRKPGAGRQDHRSEPRHRPDPGRMYPRRRVGGPAGWP